MSHEPDTVSKEKMEEIRRKAKKLMAFNENSGASQGEIDNAAAILSRMLTKYQLSMADLANEELGEDTGYRIFMYGKRFVGWKKVFYSEILSAYDCRMVKSNTSDRLGLGGMYGFGLRSDLEIALYMAETLLKVCRDMAQVEGWKAGVTGGQLTQFQNSFTMGCAQSLKERIKNERMGATSDERGLAVVKDKAVAKAVNKVFPNLVKGSKVGIRNASGYLHGKEAGRSIPLTKGVNGGTSTPRRLR